MHTKKREELKRLEFEFGKAFFKELNEGSIDSLIHDDNPDFFTSNERYIGFELTQIHNETVTESTRAHVEGSWDSLMYKLKEIWDSKLLPSCHVRLYFREPIPINKKRIAQEAEEIVILISQHLPEPDSEYRSPDWMLINIPNLIGFEIERIFKHESSIWSYSDSIWAPSLNPLLIQETIDKKEKKRKAYLKRCYEIWLVIALYGGRASGNFNIPAYTTKHNYSCYFDRLFLFDCIPKKIYELNRKIDIT